MAPGPARSTLLPVARRDLLNAALGKEACDLLVQGAQVLDVFSGQFRPGDLAIHGGTVVGFGALQAQKVERMEGAFIVPGLIDAHVHLESSRLSPQEFARAVVARGTTAVIADPHEIANVLGLEGLRYMLRATEHLPLKVFFMAPSCVPASPLETAGAVLGAAEIAQVFSWPRVLGLGEVMNFPGALAGDCDLWAKIEAARGRAVDGHAPGLTGPSLWAYALSGPRTDHECTSLEEAREKLGAGLHVLIREGTAARNLAALLPLLNPRSAPFVHFCTDDREPETLVEEGHMDDVLRKAISGGVDPEVAFASATVHTARLYGLPDLGALAPGYRADFLVLSDPRRVKVEAVYVEGRKVAEGGLYQGPSFPVQGSPSPMNVHLKSLSLRVTAGPGQARVIRVLPDQVVTEEVRRMPKVVGGEVVADPDRDVLKLAVVERHRGTGNVGLGLVQGFALRRGALASTVAHDSHNIIVVGASDEDMHIAVEELVKMGGGQLVVEKGQVLASLPLPVAGLMSDRPLEEVHRLSQGLRQAARALGCRLPDPFMTLSFLALPVIPALKLTDLGLVDVQEFRVVPLFVG